MRHDPFGFLTPSDFPTWEILQNLQNGSAVDFADCYVRLDGTGKRAVVQQLVDLAAGKTGLWDL